jgi:CBS domain containing-hemolysin-like protein
LFQWFYRFFLPASMPLVWIARLLEKLSSSSSNQVDFLLGRHRLIQVLSKGHEHGVLTNQQGILVHGLLHDATRPISEIMIPIETILGEDEHASRETLLEYARQNHLTHIPVRRHESASDWFGYVRVLDLELGFRPAESMIRTMPEIPADSTRLMALLTIRDSGESVGVITAGDNVHGIIMENTLIDHLMHPLGVPGTRSSTPPTTSTAAANTE